MYHRPINISINDIQNVSNYKVYLFNKIYDFYFGQYSRIKKDILPKPNLYFNLYSHLNYTIHTDQSLSLFNHSNL